MGRKPAHTPLGKCGAKLYFLHGKWAQAEAKPARKEGYFGARQAKFASRCTNGSPPMLSLQRKNGFSQKM